MSIRRRLFYEQPGVVSPAHLHRLALEASPHEALLLAGAANGVRVDVVPILSDDLTAEDVAAKLDGVSGVLVAPGFGDRGIDGKIEAVRFARENGIPFFGICLGMQVAVVEFARNVCGWAEAHSTEFMANTPLPIISLMS